VEQAKLPSPHADAGAAAAPVLGRRGSMWGKLKGKTTSQLAILQMNMEADAPLVAPSGPLRTEFAKNAAEEVTDEELAKLTKRQLRRKIRREKQGRSPPPKESC